MRIIISECKEVSLSCKTNICDWANEIFVSVLIRLCYSRLGVAIILFLGFYFFIRIVDEPLCIINKFDILMCEMFFQHGEV